MPLNSEVICQNKMESWNLILVLLFVTNSLDKSESVQLEELEELPLQTFEELFVDEWWDKDEAEDLKTPSPTNFGQNFHRQIDRQNTQIGQIEPNSTDQNLPLTESDHTGQNEPNSTDQNAPLTESDHTGQNEPNSTDQNAPLTVSDHSGQIEPNSTDQNLPLIESDHSGQNEPNTTDQNPPPTESDHSGQSEVNSTDQNPPSTESDHSGQSEPNSTDQNPPPTESDHSYNANSSENIGKDERKRKIIDEFHEIKDEFKQKGKYSTKKWIQIDNKIAKHLKVSRKKIFEWKKEFGLRQKVFYEKEERKNLVEKFDQMKAELKRAGFKNSSNNKIDKTVAKDLGLNFTTIYRWKSELGKTEPNHKHSDSEQKKLMKRYYELKDKNPKISDENIAKRLKIGRVTLFRWKQQFNRQQFHPNSADGHSVEENATANVHV